MADSAPSRSPESTRSMAASMVARSHSSASSSVLSMSGSVTRARVPSANAHPVDPPTPFGGQGHRW